MPKGPGANPNLAAMGGSENVTVKPQVKHILSKELQLYFEKICGALLDENNLDYRNAAVASLKNDPGLHQLVPYFVQFIAEKVTHNLKNLFVLQQMMHLTEAMLLNESLYIDPYVRLLYPRPPLTPTRHVSSNATTNHSHLLQIASIVPPVLTCLVGRHLGSSPTPTAHYPLRDHAASILGAIARKYAKSSHTLRPRLARTCLKHFLDPAKPLGTTYGGIIGLLAVGGPEVVRVLVVPNLKDFEMVLGSERGADDDLARKLEKEKVISALLQGIEMLEADSIAAVNALTNGEDHEGFTTQKLREKIGPLLADRVLALGRRTLVKAVLEC